MTYNVRRSIVRSLLLTLAPTAAAWAQQPVNTPAPTKALYGYLGGGGTDAASSSGGAFVVGVTGRVRSLLATFTPLDLILYPDDSPGSDGELASGGEFRCGDSSGSNFVEKRQCVSATYGYSLDIAALVPRTPLFAGAGARFDRDHNQWFGTAGYAWFNRNATMMVLVKGMIGQDLRSGVVNIGFRVAGR